MNNCIRTHPELEGKLKSVTINHVEEDAISTGGRENLVPLVDTLCSFSERSQKILERLGSIINKLEI